MLERVLHLFNRVPHAEVASRPGAIPLDDVAELHDLLAWAAELPDAAIPSEVRAPDLPAHPAPEARRWAVLADAARRSYGYLPSDEQIVAARTLAAGGAARVPAAEDCGLILGLAAADACLRGRVVHVLESEPTRARALKGALSPLFSRLGIPLLSADDAQGAVGRGGVALVCTPEHAVRHLAGAWWEPSAGWPAFAPGAVALVPDPSVVASSEPAARIRVGAGEPIAAEIVERAGLVAERLKEGLDFKVDRRLGVATLTERGIGAVERRMDLDKPADTRFAQFVHQLGQAMLAGSVYRRGSDYDVLDGDIVPLDRTTLRPLPGRRFRHGLHEALQRKEGLAIRGVPPVSASLTPASLLGSYANVGTIVFDASPGGAGEAGGATKRGRELSAWSHTGDGGKYLSMSVEIEAAAAERRPVLGVFRHMAGAEQVAALLRERSVDCDVLDGANDAGAAVVRATHFGAPPILWVCPAHPRLARAPCTPPPALVERLQDLLIVAETLGASAAAMLPLLAAPLGMVASYRRHLVPSDEASEEASDGSDEPSRTVRLLDTALAATQAEYFRSYAALRHEVATAPNVVELALSLATPELVRLLDAFLPEDNAERWDRAGLLRVLGQYAPGLSLPDIRSLRRMRPAGRLDVAQAQVRSAWQRLVADGTTEGRAPVGRGLLQSIVESSAQRLNGSLDDLAHATLRPSASPARVGATTRETWRASSAAYEEEARSLGSAVRLEIGQEVLASLGQLAAESQQPAAQVSTVRRERPKVGRNDPCPCGSGKKFKRCCGAPSADSTRPV